MKKDIINLSIKLGAAFVVIAGIFAVTYYENAELAKELLAPYLETMGESMPADDGLSFKELWLNNLFVCAQTVAIGIIPLIFLPMIMMLSNGTLFGTLLGLSAAESQINLMDAVLYMVLPHSIFELPALSLTFGLGFYLCRWMTGRLLRKNLQDDRTFINVMNGVAKGFVLVIIPLLTISALVEYYVTPQIVTWAGLV